MQVTNPTLKQDAGNVVKHIEGVEKVDNQIEVLPPSAMDDGLRLQLYRSIYGFPALEKYAMPVVKPIRIIVKIGHVTLEGMWTARADKDMAGIRANSRLRHLLRHQQPGGGSTGSSGGADAEDRRGATSALRLRSCPAAGFCFPDFPRSVL